MTGNSISTGDESNHHSKRSMAESLSLCSWDHRSGIHIEHDLLQNDGYSSCYKKHSKAAGQFILNTVGHGRYDFENSKMACHQNGRASGPFQRRNRTCLAARKLNMKPEKNSSREDFMTPITNGLNENQESPKFRDEKNDPVRSSSFCHSFSKDNNTKKNVGNSFVSSGEKNCRNRRAKSCSALPVWPRQETRNLVPCSPRRANSETVAELQGKDGEANAVRNHNGNATSNGKDLNALLNQLDEKDRVIAEQENELQRMLLEKQDVLTELSSTIHNEDGEDSTAKLCKELDASRRQSAKLEEDNKTLALKLELEEDLRRNDKECIDMLRKQIHEIEDKLQASDRQVRELEHEKRRSQSMCKCSADLSLQAQGKVPDLLKLKYKLELNQATINAIENEYAKLKESKITLEKANQHDQEVLIQLKHQLANSQADNKRKEERINHLEEERQCLEDYQRKCRSLQRRDQKSCYALQLQIVDLQEKLETSEKVLKESREGRNSERQKIEKLEENLKKLEGKYRTKLEEALNRVKSLKARALKDNLQSTEKFTDEINSLKAKTHELEVQNSFLRTELESKRTSNGASSIAAEGPLNSAFILLEELIKSRGKLNGISTTKLIDSLQEFVKEYFIPIGESVLVKKDVSEEKNKLLVPTTKESPPLHHNRVNVQDQQLPFRGPLKVLKVKKVSHEKISSFESDVRQVKESSSSPRTFQALTSPVSLRKSGKKLLRCMSSQGQGKREASS